MNRVREKSSCLLRLSHELAREERGLVILAEGNASAKVDKDTFLVKASGSSLRDLTRAGIVQCHAGALLPLLDKKRATDAEIEETLLKARIDAAGKRPSVETLFHCYLLSLPGVEFVGHTHPRAVAAILCSPRARDFAGKRILPDEIVCCDVASVFVPYTDPGLALARAIRSRTEAFLDKHQHPPRVVLLENHGIIALGPTPDAVLASTQMAEKAASIWLHAAALGGPKYLKPHQVRRIAIRPDEDVRRRMLKL